MKKDFIDDHAPAYEFTFDPLAPPDKIIAAREALARYLERTRREKADPPPDGVGLDGYPLQRGENSCQSLKR